MSPAFSVYLDLVRFLAACLVVVYHSNLRLIVATPLPLSSHGHSAVIIFFVLSGYVIAFATDTKESDPRSYWASRLSRIMSLAIVAVLLTPVLDLIGQTLAPALYEGNTTHGLTALRIASSLIFMNEIWMVSIMSFSNIAYWSLNYEFWYYALFAVYTFAAPTRRWFWIGLVCLLLGPKILLLAPIWCLGVVIYRWRTPQNIPEWLGWLLVLASVGLFLAFEYWHVSEQISAQILSLVGKYWYRELAFSKWFVADYLLAGIVFMNFVGMRRVVFRMRGVMAALAQPVRWCAGFTFSLYILHQPLIYFYAAMIDLPPTGYLRYAGVMGCVLATVVVIGSLTEQKRHHLRRHILLVFDNVARSAIWQRWLASRPAGMGAAKG